MEFRAARNRRLNTVARGAHPANGDLWTSDELGIWVLAVVCPSGVEHGCQKLLGGESFKGGCELWKRREREKRKKKKKER